MTNLELKKDFSKCQGENKLGKYKWYSVPCLEKDDIFDTAIKDKYWDHQVKKELVKIKEGGISNNIHIEKRVTFGEYFDFLIINKKGD